MQRDAAPRTDPLCPFAVVGGSGAFGAAKILGFEGSCCDAFSLISMCLGWKVMENRVCCFQVLCAGCALILKSRSGKGSNTGGAVKNTFSIVVFDEFIDNVFRALSFFSSLIFSSPPLLSRSLFLPLPLSFSSSFYFSIPASAPPLLRPPLYFDLYIFQIVKIHLYIYKNIKVRPL